MQNTKIRVEIEAVTVDKLNGGEYAKVLPEFYELKTVIENSPWHIKQTVFDHVMKVYEALENLLINSKLDPQRKKLLKIATLLHDIAKKDTLIVDQNGMARCPGHEMIGAARVKNFADRFGLDGTEAKTVEKIVLYHGFISDVVTLTMLNGEMAKYKQIFREVVGEVAEELLILMRADLLGSDLGKSITQEFEARIEIVRKLNEDLVP